MMSTNRALAIPSNTMAHIGNGPENGKVKYDCYKQVERQSYIFSLKDKVSFSAQLTDMRYTHW